MFAWLGLIVTLLVWLGLGLLLVRWRSSRLGSISAHGSSAPGAAWLFKLILVGGGLLYYWWLVQWYVPQLHLPSFFTTLLTVVVIYQFATGLNNETSGLKHDIHVYTAQTMSLLYIPLTVLIVNSPRLHVAPKIICSLLLVYLVNSFVLVEVMKRFKAQHLVLQLLYIVVFQLVILTSAYIA
jgi:hypothetical protein